MKNCMLLCMLLYLAGFLLFLKGFFPIKLAVPGHATWENVSVEPDMELSGSYLISSYIQL